MRLQLVPEEDLKLAIDSVDERALPLDEWPKLAEQSGNVFATWEWVSIWWRHFGNGRRLLPIILRSPAGRLVGIVPLYEFARRPLTVVRFVGHGLGDMLGPICAPDDRDDVAYALHQVLTDRAWGWDVLLAERLSADQGWSDKLGGRRIKFEANPLLRIGDMTWRDFLLSRSRNFREQLRRAERRLASHHEYRIRSADQDRLEEDMKTLFELHEARWMGQGTRPFAGRRGAFHVDCRDRAWRRRANVHCGRDSRAAAPVTGEAAAVGFDRLTRRSCDALRPLSASRSRARSSAFPR